MISNQALGQAAFISLQLFCAVLLGGGISLDSQSIVISESDSSFCVGFCPRKNRLKFVTGRLYRINQRLGDILFDGPCQCFTKFINSLLSEFFNHSFITQNNSQPFIQ